MASAQWSYLCLKIRGTGFENGEFWKCHKRLKFKCKILVVITVENTIAFLAGSSIGWYMVNGRTGLIFKWKIEQIKVWCEY